MEENPSYHPHTIGLEVLSPSTNFPRLTCLVSHNLDISFLSSTSGREGLDCDIIWGVRLKLDQRKVCTESNIFCWMLSTVWCRTIENLEEKKAKEWKLQNFRWSSVEKCESEFFFLFTNILYDLFSYLSLDSKITNSGLRLLTEYYCYNKFRSHLRKNTKE